MSIGMPPSPRWGCGGPGSGSSIWPLPSTDSRTEGFPSIRCWVSSRGRKAGVACPPRGAIGIEARARCAVPSTSTLSSVSAGHQIVVCDGDETGQELLEEALRVLEPGVLGFDLE